jgi:SAM-dependent methyltransferase
MTDDLSSTFRYAGVAAAYRHRPPYPEEVFEILRGLAAETPRVVLDLGAGEGALARPMAVWADRVDAVEISAAMVAAGRGRPGGADPRLRWITAAAETAPLDGPYSLITAGASLHWMSWPALMPRLAGALSPRGVLAIVEHGPAEPPWQDDVVAVIRRHSRSRSYDPQFSLVEALRSGGFLTPLGHRATAPVPFRQSVDEYVEQFHSTASLAREHMTASEVREFGAAVRAAVAPWSRDGHLEMPIVATIDWGRVG